MDQVISVVETSWIAVKDRASFSIKKLKPRLTILFAMWSRAQQLLPQSQGHTADNASRLAGQSGLKTPAVEASVLSSACRKSYVRWMPPVAATMPESHQARTEVSSPVSS